MWVGLESLQKGPVQNFPSATQERQHGGLERKWQQGPWRVRDRPFCCAWPQTVMEEYLEHSCVQQWLIEGQAWIIWIN